MDTSSIDHKNDFALYIQKLLSTVSLENPLEYFNDMYKSINPHCITLAKEEGRKVLQAETTKKGDKTVNVYLTLGGDSINKFLMEGIIAALLWLPSYIRDVTEVFKLSREDVETTLKVLNVIQLPQVFDARDIDNGEAKETSSNCRHYASFLIAIIRWLTTGVTMFKQTGDETKTNIELCRYLASTALNTFPSIPYCAYFIGQTKTNDMAKLAEKLAKSVNFGEFMSKESYQINAPKFVVQTQDAPLVGISRHPLGELYVGMMDDTTKKTEWLGVFVKSEEFERLCAANGLTMAEVNDYLFKVPKVQHDKILQNKNHKQYKIANFIETQGGRDGLFKFGYETFHKNDNKYFVTDDDFYKPGEEPPVENLM